MDELFTKQKPVIGMIHLLPLIGSYRYRGGDEKIVQRAVKDAGVLEQAGLDAIMVENFGDAPFRREGVGAHTIAQMTDIIGRIRQEVGIPVGVNVLRNDAFSALAIARVTGCSFIRVNVLSGVVVTDQGLIQGRAAELLAYKKEIGCEARIFADVQVKHGTQLHAQDLVTMAEELVHRAGADAVIVTGRATGTEIDVEELKALKEAVDVPVLAGSGVTLENLTNYYPHCDGMIVGSHFRDPRDLEGDLDFRKLQLFVREMEGLRKGK